MLKSGLEADFNNLKNAIVVRVVKKEKSRNRSFVSNLISFCFLTQVILIKSRARNFKKSIAKNK